MSERQYRLFHRFRSIEAAAIAGLVFSVLAVVSEYLLGRTPGGNESDETIADWYASAGNQHSVVIGLNLLIVAMLAFLWFVGVIRRRVGAQEERFFGTIFQGSGILLIATSLFAAMLIAAPALAADMFGFVPDESDIAISRAAGVTTSSVFVTRLSAVFMVSATTVGRISGVFPRWLVIGGYIVGLALLLAPVPNRVFVWVFPVWVAIVSIRLLLVRRLFSEPEAAA